jgi:hypothetical protein
MKAALLLVVTVMLFAKTLPAQQLVPDSGPSLQATEDWISQTFNSGDNTGRSDCAEFEPGLSDHYGSHIRCSKTDYRIQMDSCRVTFFLTTYTTRSPGSDGQFLQIESRKKSVVSFDLHDIDPASIKAGETQWLFGNSGEKKFHGNFPAYSLVSIDTADEKDRISTVFPTANGQSGPYMTHSYCSLTMPGIAVRPEYAPRFVKAMRHAAELCGGRSSPF